MTAPLPQQDRDPARPVFLKVEQPRATGQVVQAIVTIAVVLAIVAWFVTSGVFDLSTSWEYLFSPAILEGLWNTLTLATLSTALAIILGTLVALARISPNRVLSVGAAIYVYLFRGTPMLVQMLIWYFAIPRMIGRVTIGIPFTDVVFIDNVPASQFFTPFLAGLFALTLAETGYMAEVIRAGISGVDQGQRDAARALGLPRRKVMLQVVLAQAFRIQMPALGNQYIMMIKNTSLGYAIGYMELLLSASRIYQSNFQYLELLLVAAFWYLVLTALVTFLQNALEHRFPAR
ncbi:amino acid ABC transporter permease [Agromyces rhizosphaerae]|uniref:Amino acid ABC transporter permease n=1 Tax=Agromyces rhizosphaerae TaxID=88374 RepID=A0A9W6FPM2_9MICO|nr:amino acid ABC transporter permease [Agromyces rhizosphaerae]GLI27600.1 amino acid ABC transporter permease [Agromyces rhizosphaerae]